MMPDRQVDHVLARKLSEDYARRDALAAEKYDREFAEQRGTLAHAFDLFGEYGPLPADPAPVTPRPPPPGLHAPGPDPLDSLPEPEAEKIYTEACQETTGEAPGERFYRQKADREKLLIQSHELARRLESAGVQAYRKDNAGLWIYYVCSQEAEQLPQFRRICFLPHVAAQVRAGKLAALEFFLSRNPFCRFWTFTSGPRVTGSQLRARIEWLHAKLNELNQWLRAQWQVELVFRSTELGTLEFDAAGNRTADKRQGRIEFRDGEPLFHPHTHCVMQSLRGFIPPQEWETMFAAIWEKWRDDAGRQLNWDGGRKGKSGVIRKTRELCKYVTKPGDMLRLSPAQLAATEAALHGLHLVQPLGQLRREIAARHKAHPPRTLIRQKTPDGCIWREVPDWNKWAEQNEHEREFAGNRRAAERIDAESRARHAAKPGETPHPIDKDQPWTRIFSRLLPATGPQGIKEPRIVVGGNVLDLAFVRHHPLTVKLWQETIEAYDGGLRVQKTFGAGAPALISVHTGTPTANADPPDPDPHGWDDARPVEKSAYFAR